MNKRTKAGVVLGALCILLIIILCGIVFISWLDPEKRISSESETFQIYPETIIETLRQGNKDVFFPISKDLDDEEPILTQIVEWDYSDLFLIADSLHQKMWGESLDKWSLSLINFSWDCSQIESGPNYASFIFYRIEYFPGKNTRYESYLRIEPLKRQVYAEKVEYYPTRFRRPTINLSELDISMDQAIIIAENNGGYDTRISVNNKCELDVLLKPYRHEYKGWRINYYVNGEEVIYQVLINPHSGKIDTGS